MQEAFCIILMCVLHQDFAGLPGKRDTPLQGITGPALPFQDCTIIFLVQHNVFIAV